MFLTSLKQICNEYLIKFSENQSAPKLENRKTSPCSPCAPNLLHVLLSRTTGYHNLCSPVHGNCNTRYKMILHGNAWYYMVLQVTAWYCMVWHGIAWCCMVLLIIALYYTLIHFIIWFYLVTQKNTGYCM